MLDNCPQCGSELKKMKELGCYMCVNEGCDFDINFGETYEEIYAKGCFDDPEDIGPDMSEGCISCGNSDYPMCTTWCDRVDE